MSECTVQFGANTRVSSVVTCLLIPPPHSDRPNDGAISFSVDLSPMSAMGFEYVQPSSTLTSGGQSQGGMGQAQDEGQKLLSNRILRIMERTLLNGGAIDAEALCVQSGKWVWRLQVDVTVLDHGGNLVDACVLSAVAALRHFRKPEVEIADSGGPTVLHSDEREPTPLPLHHTPLTVTFALYADPTGASTTVSALIDPSYREELVTDGTTTFSFNKYGEMCSLDFPGGCELKPRQLIICARLGKRKCVELCDILENALLESDQKAVQERLDRLKLANGFGNRNDAQMPDIADDAPFVERTDLERDGDMMEVEQDGLRDKKAEAIAAAEEESYRILALDYAQGHVAAKVKEDKSSSRGRAGDRSKGKGPIFGGSLMAAMLKSAGDNVDVGDTVDDLELQSKSNKSASSRRTKEADDEFAMLVETSTKASEQSSSTRSTKASGTILSSAMALDSDEEEETTTLQSEFTAAQDKDAEEVTKRQKVTSTVRVVKKDDGEDVDDLAMAVKSKKKKKSKKNKK